MNIGTETPFSIFLLIKSGVIKPIIEEIIFRGFILGGIIYYIDYYKKSKLILTFFFFLQILLFTLLHTNYSLDNLVVIFLLGLNLSTIFLISNKNLLPPILCHIIWNSIILISSN